MTVRNIDNAELSRLLAEDPGIRLLDVRTPEEYALLGHIPQAVLIPIDDFLARMGELDPNRGTVVVCQHGVRSAAVAEYLDRNGFARVLNLAAGMAEWDGPVENGLPQGHSSHTL